MKTTVLIRIPPISGALEANTVVQWGHYNQACHRIGDIHLGTVEELSAELQADSKAEDSKEQDIVLLLSGLFCFYQEIVINEGQKKHVNTALPYLVEEHLAQDIDAMHIARGLPDKNLKIPVAAISHEVLQSLLSLFDSYEMSPSHIVPEMQFLGVNDDITTLFLENHSFLLSRSHQNGQGIAALNYDALPFVLGDQIQPEVENRLKENISESSEHLPERIRLRYSDKELMLEPSRLEAVSDIINRKGFQLEQQPLSGTLLDYFSQGFFEAVKSNRAADFRQGSYRCPRKTNRLIKRWWPVAALAICWLLVELGFTVAEGLVYQQKQASLWNDSMSSYLYLFPNDRQALQAQKKQQLSFNAKKLLENRFKNLDSMPEISPFLPMLQKASAAIESMSTTADLNPESLDFNQQARVLKLELSADKLETVNQLVSVLNSAGLVSRLDRSKPDAEGVIASISIREEG